MMKTGVIAALLLLSAPASAQSITGRASVIDGDTFEIQGQRIRLHGVDAPESSQACKDASGKDYRCGQKAALALAAKIGSSPVTCDQTDTDRYKRMVAQCHQPGLNINAWLVSEGYAMAYRQYGTEYVGEEDEARAAKKGIWAGSFTPPWDWRRGARDMTTTAGTEAEPPRHSNPIPAPRVETTPPSAPSTAECRIKGNINNKGDRIYHVPGSRHYEGTQVNTRTGERWFCSEGEAEAAGWRASSR